MGTVDSHTFQNSSTKMMKLLVCSLTLTALVAGHPAPAHYLIETEGDARDDPAEMEQAVEKGSKVEIDEKDTDGEIIEEGEEGEKKDGEDYYCPDCTHEYDEDPPGTFW